MHRPTPYDENRHARTYPDEAKKESVANMENRTGVKAPAGGSHMDGAFHRLIPGNVSHEEES